MIAGPNNRGQLLHMSIVSMTLADADALVMRVLTENGCDAANARAVADVVMAAERDICHSHGVFRIPGYAASLRSGKVKGDAAPTVRQIAPSVLRVDGDGGFAPLALETGRQPLIDLAREQGIAALSVTDIFHFSALWVEVEAIADQGLVAFAWTAASPMVAPAGGTAPLFGTNPMAFGWPRKDGPPMVFDQASAAMARGDVMIHARDGKTVPPGVGIDPDGNGTTDPNAVLAGAQLPFGGHKGSAIAMMIELLAGALIGEDLSFESGARDNKDGGPPHGGELMIAVDPNRFGDPDGWLDRGERLFAKIAEQPGTRLPGARRHANRTRTPEEGIEVPTALHETILGLLGGP